MGRAGREPPAAPDEGGPRPSRARTSAPSRCRCEPVVLGLGSWPSRSCSWPLIYVGFWLVVPGGSPGRGRPGCAPLGGPVPDDPGSPRRPARSPAPRGSRGARRPVRRRPGSAKTTEEIAAEPRPWPSRSGPRPSARLVAFLRGRPCQVRRRGAVSPSRARRPSAILTARRAARRPSAGDRPGRRVRGRGSRGNDPSRSPGRAGGRPRPGRRRRTRGRSRSEYGQVRSASSVAGRTRAGCRAGRVAEEVGEDAASPRCCSCRRPRSGEPPVEPDPVGQGGQLGAPAPPA